MDSEFQRSLSLRVNRRGERNVQNQQVRGNYKLLGLILLYFYVFDSSVILCDLCWSFFEDCGLWCNMFLDFGYPILVIFCSVMDFGL